MFHYYRNITESLLFGVHVFIYALYVFYIVYASIVTVLYIVQIVLSFHGSQFCICKNQCMQKSIYVFIWIRISVYYSLSYPSHHANPIIHNSFDISFFPARRSRGVIDDGKCLLLASTDAYSTHVNFARNDTVKFF